METEQTVQLYDVNRSPFPVPSSFVLSYVQGYCEGKTVPKLSDFSHCWGCRSEHIGSLMFSNPVALHDYDLIESNFSLQFQPTWPQIAKRVENISTLINEHKKRMEQNPEQYKNAILPIKWWVKWLRDGGLQAQETTSVFIDMYKDGRATKSKPGVFLGPRESETEHDWYKRMDVSQMTGPIYLPSQKSDVKCETRKPTKPSIVPPMNGTLTGAAKHYGNSSTNATKDQVSTSVTGIVEFNGSGAPSAMNTNTQTAASSTGSRPVIQPAQQHKAKRTLAWKNSAEKQQPVKKQKLTFEE